MKTFLYEYSIIAWITVVYEALERGDLPFTANLHSVSSSTQTFMLDVLVYLFSDRLNWKVVWACVCVCFIFLLWTYSTYLLFGNLYELIRAFFLCVLFFLLVWFCWLFSQTWLSNVVAVKKTNHDHQWKVYSRCCVWFSTSSGCLKFGATF